MAQHNLTIGGNGPLPGITDHNRGAFPSRLLLPDQNNSLAAHNVGFSASYPYELIVPVVDADCEEPACVECSEQDEYNMCLKSRNLRNYMKNKAEDPFEVTSDMVLLQLPRRSVFTYFMHEVVKGLTPFSYEIRMASVDDDGFITGTPVVLAANVSGAAPHMTGINISALNINSATGPGALHEPYILPDNKIIYLHVLTMPPVTTGGGCNGCGGQCGGLAGLHMRISARLFSFDSNYTV